MKETTETYTFVLGPKELEEKYPMADPQLAQVDCRLIDCIYNKGAGQCENVAPAITLNPKLEGESQGTFVCWSHKTAIENCERKEESSVELLHRYRHEYAEQGNEENTTP
jgi:hypothetical protein